MPAKIPAQILRNKAFFEYQTWRRGALEAFSAGNLECIESTMHKIGYLNLLRGFFQCMQTFDAHDLCRYQVIVAYTISVNYVRGINKKVVLRFRKTSFSDLCMNMKDDHPFRRQKI
ncbi:UNVERIFIED_CONTAM: hypothetical protein NCL1_47857 [Trichonephila clavipes]